MKKTNYFSSLAMVIIIALTFSSCKKTPEPVALFSSAVDGLVVTFTNSSTDADTYAWNFGDGNTSTEMSPVHTYVDFGLYSVTLTVTGEGGEAIETKDIELVFAPLMTIDGDFSKWDNIDDFVAGDGGSITKVKMANDSKYWYIYIEGTDALRGFFDIYINTDDDALTGASTWVYPAGAGAEYLLEGFIADTGDADLFLDNPETEDWAWDVALPVGSGLITASSLKAVTGGKAIEISILRELATELGDVISVGFVDVAEDWSMQGGLPIIGDENSALLKYTF
ncbi:MAG: PKD domain-containing protein [Bacteroidales bacterium]|nr:PKD domain-containing protein [Bacteroidales bacterium]